VRIGERRWPYRVVATTRDGATIEIAGEPIVIAGWPTDESSPTKPVVVAGELLTVLVASASGAAVAASPTRVATSAPVPGGSGAIVPPMPGRILEVRVSEGQTVAADDVLVVLEAMKMRNEVRAPRAGTVRKLRVRAGDSVRANEPMLEIEPG
jgi:glutaconyl-CoA/methylmalonyl-CoA decarboxylase subunit gamma